MADLDHCAVWNDLAGGPDTSMLLLRVVLVMVGVVEDVASGQRAGHVEANQVSAVTRLSFLFLLDKERGGTGRLTQRQEDAHWVILCGRRCGCCGEAGSFMRAARAFTRSGEELRSRDNLSNTLHAAGCVLCQHTSSGCIAQPAVATHQRKS
ncbi:hypothetical protein E2C01_024276 [Portunus trituberculatus]|uniref:Uncharacterized protein n=1 Tax=Portunus trituberculatus TaxID=210409 RepID=A0A5B7EE56_PORTR|nr:hypothetical protein [Portunus trituberculatus]